jgi:NADH-quinone oxidoreductase subunit L
MTVSTLLYLLLSLPLVGAAFNVFLGKRISKTVSGGFSTLVIAAGFMVALMLFNHIGAAQKVKAFRLLTLSNFSLDVQFLLDSLSLWMTLIITGIGTLIHLFSMGYMSSDEGYSKFFVYLNLFIFAMLLLVLGSNYFVLFFGWEGVGICSFLLIGFHYSDAQKGIANSLAARKAFVMNRIGDVGLLFACFMLLATFHSLEFDQIAAAVQPNSGFSFGKLTVLGITLCLFLAATGKSAQIPLFTWLPDAMAGPTPVSALIHAATMVTAGIYMVTRSNFLFELAPIAKEVMLYGGIATSLVAAFMALRQNDIKKVLAYSTVSQLGLMVVALGLGAYTVAIFHVTTHAFFKALLFLGSGSVIHGMHHEQDIRKMGGLRKGMPITHATFLIGTLAITGFPLLSGFYSKDEIIGHLFESNLLLYVVIMFSVLMTAVYMFRLYFLTFHGTFRGSEEQWKHVHESPSNMTIPLMVLSVLSVFGGLLNLPGIFIHKGSHWLSSYLNHSYGLDKIHGHEASQNVTLMLMAVASIVCLGTLLWAYQQYVKKASLAKEDDALTGWEQLSARKLYWDEIYHQCWVSPTEKIGTFLNQQAEKRFFLAGVFGLAAWSKKGGEAIGKIQNGKLSSYLGWMVVGLTLLVLVFLLKVTFWN